MTDREEKTLFVKGQKARWRAKERRHDQVVTLAEDAWEFDHYVTVTFDGGAPGTVSVLDLEAVTDEAR